MNLKCGPGAAVLPPEITRIHMDFALKINGGHMGAKYAEWRPSSSLQYADKLELTRHHCTGNSGKNTFRA